jgi:hypothetical protein
MISHMPNLTSITIEEWRDTIYDEQKEEMDMIEAFCQVNPWLKVFGMSYCGWEEYDVVWRAAPPSIVESSRGINGEACTWTPDPFHQYRWKFWLETFGEPPVARQAMLERWPKSSVPSITDLVRYSQRTH